MSAVRGGDPVGSRGALYSPASVAGDTSAFSAASKTARIFNQELHKLNALRGDASEKGEVVVTDRVALEYERKGMLLAARSGDAEFASKQPRATPAEQPGTTRQQTAEPAPPVVKQALPVPAPPPPPVPLAHVQPPPDKTAQPDSATHTHLDVRA